MIVPSPYINDGYTRMNTTRKIVVFPTSKFFAIVGTITMAEDPYDMSLTDICNFKSHATHHAREHEHKPGKLFLTDTEFYSLKDNSQRQCVDLDQIHIALKDIEAIIDVEPAYFTGNKEKRAEQEQRYATKEKIRFVLRSHVISGSVDSQKVYRNSGAFVSISHVSIDDADNSSNQDLSQFLESIKCPQPAYMAIYLENILHS